MGAYASNFHKSGGKVLLEEIDPSHHSWISAHAETCKMSVPEVMRCWSRFLMLDPDSNGNVKRTQFFIKDPYSEKLLQQIPTDGDEMITFQAYCSAVSWLAKAPQESKLRGFYQTLTSSTLTYESLHILISDLYPNKEPKMISDLCHLMLSEIDKESKGEIDEDQFVFWVQSMPQDQVSSVLQFPILPPDGASSSERVLPYMSASTDVGDKWRVRDEQLQQVASLMAKRRRDWRLLANNLGFLEKDSIFFEQNHSELREKILDMLQTWRNTSGEEAQLQTLQKALKQTSNADIANEIFNLNF
ncbi:uncharacterized protein LOC120914841 isoform X1 [Rana temporaria]|uniref:uncharacterized protein LOC120914841 isoform X1 n=2 Tax=Rana temporaria TaxID=8407 RepID=UPI001AAD5A1A|nr:uncharacterized protein LOC120914841 isoform X1 [Rana temporaria]XP_040181272.1 uncharacterized protein LOC120914841 isoform X1 [Rana temporaria]